ncbi:replication endonuclease [Caballeronia sp. ATUFL_F2_KS9A]|uniref:replication endonuclease n=1 Tax=Caballeronia sp. ATUFL_F2_KS9A TaxID=2921777 RepID=UPI0032EE5F14
MWIHARDIEQALPQTQAAQRARKRLPMKWLSRALWQAKQAGRKSAVQVGASHMFDMAAAEASISTFVEEHAPDTLPVRPDASDFEICMKARSIADDVTLRALGLSSDDALVVASSKCAEYGVELPEFDKAADIMARLKCELWWRRRLRRLHIRALEHSNIRLHYVHYRSEPYASDDAVRRRIAQNRRNEKTLESVTMENELGQRFTLAELSAFGVANKALRRGELMTRLRGCEDLAVDAKFRGVMFSLTCPSRFHAVKQAGVAKFRPNSKYDQSSPRDAQVYLRKVWARIRAQLKREGVTYFGMRVAEPNHDGTPHWHGLVFSNDIERFEAIMRKHALRDSGDEKGAAEHRVHTTQIDDAKGSAVGYIAKYVSKNIDGHAVGEHKTKEGYVVQADMIGDDEITPSQRIEAWAAQWGIRQFQQFGGAPVGVWRELRRIKEEDLPNADESPEIIAAWKAAQKTETHRANWAEYARAMGGVAGEKRLIHVKYTTEHREGRYGIAPVKVPHGVEAYGTAFIQDGICAYHVNTQIFVPATRHVWTVVQRSGAAASTRTRVNNCTRERADDAETRETSTRADCAPLANNDEWAGGGYFESEWRPE